RFLLEIDWIQEVHAPLLSVDHPLFHLVARPDSLKLRTETGLWIRLPGRRPGLGGRRRLRPREPRDVAARRRVRPTLPSPTRSPPRRHRARRGLSRRLLFRPAGGGGPLRRS